MNQWFSNLMQKITPFFKDKKKVAILGGTAAAAIAAAVIIYFAVNVWSWVENIALVMPYDVYVSATDVSSSDISATDTASDSDTTAQMTVVSFSDAVSSSDLSEKLSLYPRGEGDDVLLIMNNGQPENVVIYLRMKKGSTVAEALAQNNIVLDESLSIDTPLDTELAEDMLITICRLRYITITADGMSTSIYTALGTVGELLAEQNIVIDDDDRLSCDINAFPENNMTVTVYRVTVVDEVKAETVPFDTERRENSSMYVGKEKTVTEGVNGSKDVTYRCTYVDGILESSEKVNEVITVAPVNRVIEYGTKRTTTTTRRTTTTRGRYIVSKVPVYDCDGSGHGYYIITYSDGSVVYKDF